ncbi:hypothetical protein [Sulfurimonas microaerophilic]|uniref:hypothetical protein n=1 Tax=Sulfurimonas microaerophilic TaxID=3058392 RepID=UPI0027151D0D|nr:hypothetical protein [Sulfurimonas sp. hsl 1-7]
MEFNGDVLTIDSDMTIDGIKEFEEFIRPRIEYIETIEVEDENGLTSSALLSILASLKKTYPQLEIPFLEKRVARFEGQGTINWICHD